MLYLYGNELSSVLYDHRWPRSLTGRNLDEADREARPACCEREVRVEGVDDGRGRSSSAPLRGGRGQPGLARVALLRVLDGRQRVRPTGPVSQNTALAGFQILVDR